MGLLKRASSRSQEREWQMAALAPDERPVGYAHLAAAFDAYREPGTAFLSTRRFLWRAPSGNEFDFDLTDCVGWAVHEDQPGLVGLKLVVQRAEGVAPDVLVLYPQQPRSSANRRLAAQFSQTVYAELRRVHPEWGEPGSV